MEQERGEICALTVISHVVRDSDAGLRVPLMEENEDDTTSTQTSHKLLCKEIPRKGNSLFSQRADRHKGKPPLNKSLTTKTKERKGGRKETKLAMRKPWNKDHSSPIDAPAYFVGNHFASEEEDATNCANESDQIRVTNISRQLSQEARLTEGAKSIRKNNITVARQTKAGLIQKPQVLGRRVATMYSLVENTAETKNWMIASQEAPASQGKEVVAALHTNSRSPSQNNLSQKLENCKRLAKAVSCYDSGFAASKPVSVSKESTHLERYTSPTNDSNNLKQIPSSPTLCHVCRTEVVGGKCAFCKTCSGQDEVNYSPLDDLRAFAQIIANRVKEILMLSPDTSSKSDHRSKKCIEVSPRAKGAPSRSGPDVQLHRYKTEINMKHTQEERSKSLFNKSVSYDGRVCKEEKVDSLPQSLMSRETLFKLSSSVVSHANEDPINSGFDGNHFSVKDYKNNSTGKMERSLTKMSIKQLARVERAKTDGDLLGSPLQRLSNIKEQGKDDFKKGRDFLRYKSKTVYDVDNNVDRYDKYPLNSQQQSPVVGISREKAIHEGSPVDPPYTLERKRSEDCKGPKAAFFHSGTSHYSHHGPKREMGKINALEDAMGVIRSSSRITVRTNKASTLRKENIPSERQKVREVRKEKSCENISVKNAVSFTKKRASSIDSSKLTKFKQDEVPQCLSWSIISNGDEEKGDNLVKRKQEVESLKKQARNVYNPFFQQEESFMYQEPGLTRNETVPHSGFYGHELGNVLPPEEDVLTDDQFDLSLGNDSFHYTEALPATNQLDEDSLNSELINSPRQVADDEIYPVDMKKYGKENNAPDTISSWYSPSQNSDIEKTALMRRHRPQESKSTTSFHLITPVRSSHSDEALMKYHGTLDHTFQRKQSIYTETDVDTGVIYHLAKRHTTRTHVPRYQTLRSVSRDIYTMSGDVSTSTSTYSAVSTKSEMSEYVYTGGYYKKLQAHPSDRNNSTRSSITSSSNIYYEPDGPMKHDSSEVDIYTGSIFNNRQNIQLLTQVVDLSQTYLKKGPQDGSTNNSICLVAAKQRRVKCRPRLDAIYIKNDHLEWENFSTSLIACDESRFSNISNNSSSWCGMDDYDGAFTQGSIVTKSKETLYTDYDPGMRPEFHLRNAEKSGPVFDFLKYENTDDRYRVIRPPSQHENPTGGGGIWYSGLYGDQNSDFSDEKQVTVPDRAPKGCLYAWQYYDDYYTSNVRPQVTRSDRDRSNSNQASGGWNTNNNHFEDIYTGSYEAQNIQSRVPEQTNNARQPTPENWYGKHQPPVQTSSTSSYEKYDSLYTSHDTRGLPSPKPEPPKNSHSATNVYADFYTETGAYMPDNGYRSYEQGPRQQTKSFNEEQRHRVMFQERSAADEVNNYFQYISNKSPRQNFYITDEDTYSFEPKVVKELSPEVPVIPEIKTVGGIVCRENVANQEDYAEDINRDLEPGPWVPFSFRREEETKYPLEMGGNHDRAEIARPVEAFGQGIKHPEENSYAHNRIYDNDGFRNKWREMNKKDATLARSRETSLNRAFQSGDAGKQEFGKSKKTAGDNILDKAKGKRTNSSAAKPAAAECSGNNKGSGNNQSRYKRH